MPTASEMSVTADATAGTCMAVLGVTETFERVGWAPKSQPANGPVSVTGAGVVGSVSAL